MIERRDVLRGLVGLALCTPAIVRVGSLMPVRRPALTFNLPNDFTVTTGPALSVQDTGDGHVLTIGLRKTRVFVVTDILPYNTYQLTSVRRPWL